MNTKLTNKGFTIIEVVLVLAIAGLIFLMFAGITLGGLGSAYGALVGGFFVGLFVELASLVVPAELKNAPALLILVVVLIVRPQGILGRKQRVG